MRSLSCKTIALTTAALGTVAGGLSYMGHHQQQSEEPISTTTSALSTTAEEEERQLEHPGRRRSDRDENDGSSSRHKPEPQCPDYHKCDCFSCGDVTERDDGTIDIQINHCKKNGRIDWICCSAVDGIAGICDVKTPDCGGYAVCDGMASGEFTVNIPQDATSFQINTHDEYTAGDALNIPGVCGGPKKGGQEGYCVDDIYTSHCLIDFVLQTDCGYTKTKSWYKKTMPTPSEQQQQQQQEHPRPPQPQHPEHAMPLQPHQHSEHVAIGSRQAEEVDTDDSSDNCNEIEEDECFSAFAYYRPEDSYCLADLGFQYSQALARGESGWTNGPFKCCFSHPYQLTLYTDAPNCYTSNIKEVGVVTIHKDGEEVSVDFNLDSELNYTLVETNVYAGETRLPMSESSFPYSHNVTKRVGCIHLQDAYTIGGFDPRAGVYVVAHALVCPAPKQTLTTYEPPTPTPKCPDTQPELHSACNFEEDCSYGFKKCCDGFFQESFVAVCIDGKVAGYHKDACKGVVCKEEPEEEEPSSAPILSPTSEPEEEEDHALHFDGFRDCAEVGYDFGYIMSGCTPKTATQFDSLIKTHFGDNVEDEESCNIHNLGQFDLVCSEPVLGGNASVVQTVTITTSLDSNVIIQGTKAGILYTNLDGNSTYTMELTQEEGQVAGIEFCFRCGCSNTTNTTSPPATFTPTEVPTTMPTVASGNPSASPSTEAPTGIPTVSPTASPTKVPTATPSVPPTVMPTVSSGHPSASPTTTSPTETPTSSPTAGPTKGPTATPSEPPTVMPTVSSGHPSASPTTSSPTETPTLSPTASPTKDPAGTPTAPPTGIPTIASGHPSASPTTVAPTVKPTSQPTEVPSSEPTEAPSITPTTLMPTVISGHPSASPTTEAPTIKPTLSPTATPTKGSSPTKSPTTSPTMSPTDSYTGHFDCHQKEYDFGFQMENCFPRHAVEIDILDQTPFRHGVDQATCQVSNVGQFDLVCSDRDMSHGGLPRKAHITPTVDTAVIIQGLTGGILYEDLKAGVNYTLDPGNSEPITDIEFCMKCDKNKTDDRVGSSFGDPHIKTWGGGHFDFHGGCDLILVESPSYNKGLGLAIHIRTKVTDWWSYIDSAVLQIGHDRLEVHGIKDEHRARYWINGTEGPDLVDGQYLDFTVGGQKIKYHDKSKKTKLFQLKDFSIETFGDFVRVSVHAKHSRDFVGAIGLMGSYPSGSMIGREGQIIWNKNHFGMEWQVRMEEPKLFHKIEGVQHPQPCEIPSMMQPKASATEVKRRNRRRLGEALSKDDAARACAPVEKEYFKDCIADVLATNDRNMAGAYY